MRRKNILIIAALVCFALCTAVRAQSVPMKVEIGAQKLESGVARELARERAARYADLHYLLRLTLAENAALMRGTEEIRFTIAAGEQTHDLILDWRMSAAAVNDSSTAQRVWNIIVNDRAGADVREESDHLIVPARHLREGVNTVRLEFASPISASGSAVTRYADREDGAEYLYTLFVPSDASTAFPCFDQPDLKARFRLEVTAPAAWRVVTNTDAESTSATNDAATRTTRFRETEPISTYLFAFAAGPFAELHDETRENTRPPTRIYVRRSKAARMREELAEVLRLHRASLKFFANYFARPYPFPKYDLVIVPEFAYGGMEHAGATFLREEAIIFPSVPTTNDLLSRAELIFHENAHQWFGDLVTMRWFDDLWLKEGFATFMAYKAIEAVLPQYNAWKVFNARTKQLAYLTDATKGTTPIWQEIPNLSAAKSAYGNIVYRKAPAMLRQAEFYVGPTHFQRAVQMFLREHPYGNAEWGDLVAALQAERKDLPLEAWAAVWVKRRGMADVRAEWSADARGRIKLLVLRQSDALGEGGVWPQRVRVMLGYHARPPQILTVMLDARRATTNVAAAVGRARPDFVFANAEDYGYGRFTLDERSREYVMREMTTIDDDFTRALLWSSLWESVREAELAPSRYIELALDNLSRERDEVTIQAILGRVLIAFNRYLSPAQRAQTASRLETFINEGMMRSSTLGLRITYFRALQSVATTATAMRWVKELLGGERAVPGLALRTRDRFDLTTTLLAGGEVEAIRLLAALRQRETSDDARRYAFAAEAARADEETKRRYFNAYLRDRELPESWIEASLPSFNHVRQPRLTSPFLQAALGELPQLKRTRKIFFINSWLAAFLGGQCSAASEKIVTDFLRDAALDRDLRLKVLEANDGLQRCVRIRNKYDRGNETATGR